MAGARRGEDLAGVGVDAEHLGALRRGVDAHHHARGRAWRDPRGAWRTRALVSGVGVSGRAGDTDLERGRPARAAGVVLDMAAVGVGDLPHEVEPEAGAPSDARFREALEQARFETFGHPAPAVGDSDVDLVVVDPDHERDRRGPVTDCVVEEVVDGLRKPLRVSVDRDRVVDIEVDVHRSRPPPSALLRSCTMAESETSPMRYWRVPPCSWEAVERSEPSRRRRCVLLRMLASNRRRPRVWGDFPSECPRSLR